MLNTFVVCIISTITSKVII